MGSKRFNYGTYSPAGAPAWAGDFRGRDQLVPGGGMVDAAQFNATDAVVVSVTAAAVAGAASVTVAALSGPVPAGTTLDFGGAKFAVLTAPAAKNATTLTVRPIPTALAIGDTATYKGVGRKLLKSGTAVGRTNAEREANAAYGPAAATDDEIMLLAYDVSDAEQANECELYRSNAGLIVKENFLPEVKAGTMIAAVLTAIRNRYVCVRGAA